MQPLLFVLVACSGPVSVRTEYDRDTDFRRYGAYDWMHEATAQAGATSLDEQVKSAVNRELLGRGYRRSSRPDFLVVHRILRAESAAKAGVTKTASDVLVLDFLDAASKQRIWRGWSAVVPDDAESLLDAAALILSNFPPGGRQRATVGADTTRSRD